MINLTCFTAILAVLLPISSSSVDPWKFIVLADWHGAENFAVKPNREDDLSYTSAREVLKSINTTYGGDLVILPGEYRI